MQIENNREYLWQRIKAFSGIQYSHVDFADLEQQFKQYSQSWQGEKNLQACYDDLRSFDSSLRSYVEACSYLLFQHEAKPQDDFYRNELMNCLANYQKLRQLNAMLKASLIKRRDLLELANLTGKRMLFELQSQYFLQQPVMVELNQQQIAISRNLINNLDKLTQPRLHMKKSQVKKLYSELHQLFRLRSQKAAHLGYANFSDLAKHMVGDYSFDEEKIAKLRSEIKKYLVPLYLGLLRKFTLYEREQVSFKNESAAYDSFIALVESVFVRGEFDWFKMLKHKGYMLVKNSANRERDSEYDLKEIATDEAERVWLQDLYLAKTRQPLFLLDSLIHITDWSNLFTKLATGAFIWINSSKDRLLENELPDQAMKTYSSAVLEALCLQRSKEMLGPVYFYRRALQILEEVLYMTLLTEYQEHIYAANLTYGSEALTYSKTLYENLHEQYFPASARYNHIFLRRSFEELLAEPFHQQLSALYKLSGLLLWDYRDQIADNIYLPEQFFELLALGADMTVSDAIERLHWPDIFAEGAVKRLAYKLAFNLELNIN